MSGPTLPSSLVPTQGETPPASSTVGRSSQSAHSEGLLWLPLACGHLGRAPPEYLLEDAPNLGKSHLSTPIFHTPLPKSGKRGWDEL